MGGFSKDPEKRKRQMEGLKKGMIPKGKTGNPHGRPRSTIRTMIQEFQDAGLIIPTNEEIGKMFLYIATLNEEELGNLMKDKTKPMMTRIIAKGVLGKKGIDVVDRIVDRAYGKMQHIDVTTNGKDLHPEPTKLIFVADRAALEKIEAEVSKPEEKEGK